MTYAELRRELMKRLEAVSDNPAFEADCILDKTQGKSRDWLRLYSDAQTALTEPAISIAEQRAKGEPLQYLLGACAFYNITLKVDKNVLIPRPDTELVVEEAIKSLPHGAVFADICSGSGAIAAAVLKNRPDTSALLCEMYPGALALSRENLTALGLAARASWLQFDALCEASYGFLPPLDAVLCNPPYIRTDVLSSLSAEVQREPRHALDGGADGMRFYRTITRCIKGHFRGGVHIIYEIGFDQKTEIETIARENKLFCCVKKDYGGNDRVAILTQTQRA